jgi:hypothetical protein
MRGRNTYLAAATLAVAALATLAPGAHATQSDDASVIVDWNQLAQKKIGGQPFSQVRQYAMLQIAMADAVVAIEGRYEAFMVPSKAPHGASAKAAAAQAAHDVLVHLIPTATADFDAELAADLAGIPPWSKATGVQVGKKVAAWVIAQRANDGSDQTTSNPGASPGPGQPVNPGEPLIEPSTLPGIWRQTFSGPAVYSGWGKAEPFAVLSPTQFLPTAFPQLETEEYATSFTEVKNDGRRPATISADPNAYSYQQRTALLWAGGMASGIQRTDPPVATPFVNVTNPFRLWYNVTRDAAQKERLSLVKTARLFALVAVSIHDSLQTAHTSKFLYRLWRPETAIPQAHEDGNSDTGADASWVPLLITPPYPSHSSNMTCIGAGAARMLRNVFGTDAKSYTAVWYKDNSAAPAVVFKENFTSFKALAVHEGNSRVWGGIHFRFELDASHDVCAKVADYVYDHKMQSDPFRRW